MKNLNMDIKTCAECPFCEYDPYYSESASDGYNCRKSGRRIKDGDGFAPDFIEPMCPLPNKEES